METVSIDDVETDAQLDVERRSLTGPLGTREVAVNHYRLGPGEGFPGGLHAHADQEELFVVLAGEATFETHLPGTGDEASEAGEVTVGAGEAIRFAPGEFQSGWNYADEELVALALGAPRDSEDVRIPVACQACGRAALRLDAGGELALVCPDCGAEHVPQPCPECGHEDVRTALGGGDEVVAVCQDCGAAFENAPLES